MIQFNKKSGISAAAARPMLIQGKKPAEFYPLPTGTREILWRARLAGLTSALDMYDRTIGVRPQFKVYRGQTSISAQLGTDLH